VELAGAVGGAFRTRSKCATLATWVRWRPENEETIDAPTSRASVSTFRIMDRMTTPVPTRFSPDEIKLLDELVAAGVGDTRSAVVRFAVTRLADAVRRSQRGAAIASSFRAVPQSAEDDDLALANAIAMTEAEPW
jgi:Arc/MetJ-type ribon-helix-helix transcriptional regulator